MPESEEKSPDPAVAKPFARDVLDIDCAVVSSQIEQCIRRSVGRHLHRRGAVVAVSGGVDSAVCAMLAAGALGPSRVFGLLLPEQDSSRDSTPKGKMVCEAAGIGCEVEDITPMLAAFGCYHRRDQAIRRLFPDYGPGYRQKITVAESLVGGERMNYFNLVVESPAGEQQKKRMPLDVYLQVVAATNMKQRTRKLMEYYHAERLNYVVIGTPNRLEYDQGFFVRGGDGLADMKPIAHLYKTQVYALASYLGLPDEICNQTPSTDTYSLPQTQEEFYFSLPYDRMDILLYAFSHNVRAEDVGRTIDLSAEQVERVYRDIASKRRTAARLHQHAIVVEDVE